MAKINKKTNKILIVGLMFLFFAVFSFFNADVAQASEIKVTDVVKLLNQARAANGLAALKENSILDQAAEAKAKDMVKNDYFAHTSPTGIDPWHWFKNVGYDYKFAGENLAVNYDNAGEQHSAWMKSPTHRANILNGNYREVGVAVIEGNIDGENSLLTVELFGTPLYVPVSATPKEIQAVPETQKVAGDEAVPLPEEDKIAIPEKANPVELAPASSDIDIISIAWLAALAVLLATFLAGPLVFLFKALVLIRKIQKHSASVAVSKELSLKPG